MQPLPLVTKGKSILHAYELSDQSQCGKPYYFDVDTWIQAIEMMICSDEIQTALQMCGPMLPGYYRDHVPQEIAEIEKRIYQQCYDPFDYAKDDDEAGFTLAEIEEQCLSGYTYPRADILSQDIKALNDLGQAPWIFEISPSHGWLPLGFSKRGFKFNFFGKNLNQKALEKIKTWLPEGVWQEEPMREPRGVNQKKILVCFEALEHMWNPHDLEQSAKKVGEEFDFIYLSTPKYTLFGGLPDWKSRRIGHVRTWTPNEFLEFANNSFPGYQWHYFDSHSMVIKGVRK